MKKSAKIQIIKDGNIQEINLSEFVVIGIEENKKALFSSGFTESQQLTELLFAFSLSHFKQTWKINDNEFLKIIDKIKRDALHIEHHDIENKLNQLYPRKINQDIQDDQEQMPNEVM